jgi:Flp pilus assembly protein TadD
MSGFGSFVAVLFGGAEKRARAHLAAGMRLAVQKRDGEAVREFREAIRLMPGLAEAHCQLGVSLMGVGVGVGAGRNVDLARFQEAVAAFREAIRLQDDARSHGHLGEALNILEQHEEAVAALEECKRLDPSFFSSVQSYRRRLECSLVGRKWDGVR